MKKITSVIIAAYHDVCNTLGHGFLENVYENSLILDLQKRGLSVKQQMPIKVHYEGQVVGEYFADLLINDLIILELKAADQIIKAHEAQLTNYLEVTDLEVGLILNFGRQAEFKRKIFSNNRKTSLKRKEWNTVIAGQTDFYR